MTENLNYSGQWAVKKNREFVFLKWISNFLLEEIFYIALHMIMVEVVLIYGAVL